MKRLIFIAVVCACVATPALADPEVRMHINGLYDVYRVGAGGEFAAEIISTSAFNSALGVSNVLDLYADSTKNQHSTSDTAENGPTFQTFCVETNEYISDHETHEVDFADYAVEGGTGGAIDMGSFYADPLSQAAAFLYEQFAKGLLPNTIYNYTPGQNRANAAGALQKAIWTLEEESHSGTAYAFGDISGAIQQFLADEFNGGATATISMLSDWRANNSQYGVKVMNLHSGSAQSQLVLVPVPAAVLLGFLGLGAAGMKLRKFS